MSRPTFADMVLQLQTMLREQAEQITRRTHRLTFEPNGSYRWTVTMQLDTRLHPGDLVTLGLHSKARLPDLKAALNGTPLRIVSGPVRAVLLAAAVTAPVHELFREEELSDLRRALIRLLLHAEPQDQAQTHVLLTEFRSQLHAPRLRAIARADDEGLAQLTNFESVGASFADQTHILCEVSDECESGAVATYELTESLQPLPAIGTATGVYTARAQEEGRLAASMLWWAWDRLSDLLRWLSMVPMALHRPVRNHNSTRSLWVLVDPPPGLAVVDLSWRNTTAPTSSLRHAHYDAGVPAVNFRSDDMRAHDDSKSPVVALKLQVRRDPALAVVAILVLTLTILGVFVDNHVERALEADGSLSLIGAIPGALLGWLTTSSSNLAWRVSGGLRVAVGTMAALASSFGLVVALTTCSQREDGECVAWSGSDHVEVAAEAMASFGTFLSVVLAWIVLVPRPSRGRLPRAVKLEDEPRVLFLRRLYAAGAALALMSAVLVGLEATNELGFGWSDIRTEAIWAVDQILRLSPG